MHHFWHFHSILWNTEISIWHCRWTQNGKVSVPLIDVILNNLLITPAEREIQTSFNMSPKTSYVQQWHLIVQPVTKAIQMLHCFLQSSETQSIIPRCLSHFAWAPGSTAAIAFMGYIREIGVLVYGQAIAVMPLHIISNMLSRSTIWAVFMAFQCGIVLCSSYVHGQVRLYSNNRLRNYRLPGIPT